MYNMFYALVLVVAILFTGCASKHVGIKEDRAFILSTQSSSSLYEYSKDDVLSKFPKSGFYPLEEPLDSLAARVLLCKVAQKRITVQYFVFHGDYAGLILAKALVEAADRGVQIDVLIDDMDIAYDDEAIAVINAHPSINVRVFNPTTSRRALHYVEMGIYNDTVGRRMHNKSFVADNSMAVFGGRNIGDNYFGLNKDGFFIDNDILSVGPLVNEITNQFDIYFNNAYSVDFEVMAKGDIDNLEEMKKEYRKSKLTKGYALLKTAVAERSFYNKFINKEIDFYFGEAELFYDMPNKISTDASDHTYHIQSKIPEKIFAKKRFHMVSPYFIPNEKMMQRVKKMRDAGVDVAILTNSLESTDQTSVYAYYSLSQKRLLEMGVRLYEVHPLAFEQDVVDQKYNRLKAMPRASLHAKTIIIDDEYFIIGSVNMDPRSRNLNTELVGIIKSKALNTYENEVFKVFIASHNAYELSLEYDENNESKIVWKATVSGEYQKFYNDGDSSLYQRMVKKMSLWFPIRDFL